MKLTVKLSEVVEHIEAVNDGLTAFYNQLTGEFYLYSDDFDDCDEQRDLDEEEGWIALPDQYEVNEYRMMSDFARSVENSRQREQLKTALVGKGAFRRFRNMVSRLNIADEWYAFRKIRYLEFARHWCDVMDIPCDLSDTPEAHLMREPWPVCKD